MSKPVLYYFDGRGRAEAIRWMLAACDIEFDEIFMKSKEQYQQLIKDGTFLFEQVPVLEIDGMKLCQSGAILRYLARKGNMHGSGLKQQVLIDMYTEGVQDMCGTTLGIAFQPKENREQFYQEGKKKLFRRYFPVFEKALSESKTSYLANTESASMADVLLIMGLLAYLEHEETILDGFPTLKGIHPPPPIKLEKGSISVAVIAGSYSGLAISCAPKKNHVECDVKTM